MSITIRHGAAMKSRKQTSTTYLFTEYKNWSGWNEGGSRAAPMKLKQADCKNIQELLQVRKAINTGFQQYGVNPPIVSIRPSQT